MHRALTIGAVAAFTALGACATARNARLEVAGEVPLSLRGESAEREFALVEASSRSVTGLSRDHWEPQRIELPPDGVYHWPRLTKNGPAYIKHHARLRGGHPTRQTALDLDPNLHAAEAEWWAAPFQAGFDVIMAIPRLIGGANKGWTVASPAHVYERHSRPAPAPFSAPAVVPIEQDEATGP